VHQTKVEKSGFRALAVGEPVEFKVEKRLDGNTQAVKVVSSITEGNAPFVSIQKVVLPQEPEGLFQFHPQQLQLNHYPVFYKPEQLPFHPMNPDGNKDNWRQMMQ